MPKDIHTSEILIKAREFEILCANIFEAKGITVERNVIIKDTKLRYEVDLILTNNNGKKVMVETKYYRTRKPNKAMLEIPIERIKRVGKDINIDDQMLIIGMPIDNKLKAELSDAYNIKIVDSNNLLFLINDNAELLSKFNDLMSDIPSEVQDKEKVEEIDLKYLFEEDKKTISTEKLSIENASERFWNEIEKITCGKESFTEYENKCAEILKYLFDENLNGWNKQLRTDDELNRYDLVCRVKRGNEFWELLIDEFHSRYIVFEFKNYCNRVKQTQVYTTEKYLFQKALRNVCFMVSRNGLDDNAVTATKGILRESGKLIIDLKDVDLYKMLKLKESGDEPSDYLFEIVDETLLKLSK
jgi:hypothetical protein